MSRPQTGHSVYRQAGFPSGNDKYQSPGPRERKAARCRTLPCVTALPCWKTQSRPQQGLERAGQREPGTGEMGVSMSTCPPVHPSTQQGWQERVPVNLWPLEAEWVTGRRWELLEKVKMKFLPGASW